MNIILQVLLLECKVHPTATTRWSKFLLFILVVVVVVASKVSSAFQLSQQLKLKLQVPRQPRAGTVPVQLSRTRLAHAHTHAPDAATRRDSSISSMRLRSSSIRAEFTASSPSSGYYFSSNGNKSPINFATSPFWMDSFQEENDEDDDGDGVAEEEEEDISYLPVNIYELPPKTYTMLQQVTKLYVESDIIKAKQQQTNNQDLDLDLGYVKLSSVLEMIDQEYKYTTIPFMIGDETISFDLSKKYRKTKRNSYDNKQGNEEQIIKGRHIVSKVLSFAALNRLPEEIAVYLFSEAMASSDIEGFDTETVLEIQRLIASFDTNNSGYEYGHERERECDNGWSSITFTHGLSLRTKRNYILSRRDRYSPWPRKSLFTRSKDVADAMQVIHEIQQFVRPPPKLIRNDIVSIEEIDQIANELNIRSELSSRRSMKDTMLTFFPKRRRTRTGTGRTRNRISLLFGNRLLRATSKQRARIFAAGRGGFIASLTLTFIWYTCSMIWQWNKLQSIEGQSMYLLRGKIDAVQRSLQKFLEVFLTTHFTNPRPTKLHRLALALVLSPVGNQALELTQQKLKISADKAVGVISSLLVVLTLALWTLIILGDATFSRSIVGTFAM